MPLANLLQGQVWVYLTTTWTPTFGLVLPAKDAKFLHADNEDCLDAQADLDTHVRRCVF